MNSVPLIGNEAIKVLLPLCEKHSTNLSCIDLSNTGITAQGILAARQSVMRGFEKRDRNFDTLTALNLEENRIGPRGIKPLLDLLRLCGNLKVLCMASNELGDEGTEALTELLRPSSDTEQEKPAVSLSTLDISSNDLTSRGGNLILRASATRWRCEPIVRSRQGVMEHLLETSLRELIISGNSFGEDFMKTLTTMYNQLSQQLRMVYRTLDKTLQEADKSAAFRVVQDTVRQFSWLSYIDVAGNEVSHAQCDSLVKVGNEINETLHGLTKYCGSDVDAEEKEHFQRLLYDLQLTIDGLPENCSMNVWDVADTPNSDAATFVQNVKSASSSQAGNGKDLRYSGDGDNVDQRLISFKAEMEERVRSIVSEVMNGVVKEAINAVSTQLSSSVLQKVEAVRVDVDRINDSLRGLHRQQQELARRLEHVEGEGQNGQGFHSKVAQEIDSLNERMDELEDTVASEQQASMQALEAIMRSTGHEDTENYVQGSVRFSQNADSALRRQR